MSFAGNRTSAGISEGWTSIVEYLVWSERWEPLFRHSFIKVNEWTILDWVTNLHWVTYLASGERSRPCAREPRRRMWHGAILFRRCTYYATGFAKIRFAEILLRSTSRRTWGFIFRLNFLMNAFGWTRVMYFVVDPFEGAFLQVHVVFLCDGYKWSTRGSTLQTGLELLVLFSKMVCKNILVKTLS